MAEKSSYESIEKHIVTKIPIVKQNATIKNVLLMLERLSNTYDGVNYIYVINNKDELVGIFSVKELFNKPKNTIVKDIMHTKLVSVSVKTTLEKTADIALKRNLKQLPVVKSKKLLGVVVSKTILSTINKALKEDIFRFAGIHKSHLEFENSLDMSVARAVKTRISWLIMGLLGAIAMAMYIGLFEATLAKYMIIAAFIPAIVYISGALGAQTQTIFVRDLAILGKEINFKKYFLKHIRISLVIALIIGTILFLLISLIWRTTHIAFVISFASFLTVLITGFNALLITFLIKKLKFDPALGSGPIATMISDFTSVVIYFLVVVLMI